MVTKHSIVIAGPQSSGKSTVFNYLKEKYPQHNFLPEINPYTFVKKDQSVHKKMDNLNIQKLIFKEDYKRTKQLVNSNDVSIIETGIFNVVYMHNIVGKEAANKQMETYISIYKKINPYIIFVDTKPQISWKRRKTEYMERISLKEKDQSKQIMAFYKDRIFKLYPLWMYYFEYMPFKKVMIRNSYKEQNEFLKETLAKVQSIL